MNRLLNQILLLAALVFFLPACQEKNQNTRLETYQKLSQEEKRSTDYAMASFELAEGTSAQLFAAEPMVTNPTSMDIDARGRVWVCESYNYGVPKDEQVEEGGRIIILEDTDADGKADKRTVFYQGEDVHIALGIAVLGNKVYVSRSPNLLVFTDEDGDDVPDKKEVLLRNHSKPGDHSLHTVVFGPDGKLYFNMGNNGEALEDEEGNVLIDKFGFEAETRKGRFIGGSIFRMNPDGTELEVMAHNFRNNYEVAVDSYGNLWQSDNDDDGNKSCRINFILDYGNYGYRDEFTRERWTAYRTNMVEKIPYRHWHQNDPGVVPNLLHTGAGSPSGITVYEGQMLPEIYQGEMLHAEAGPNVIRAYPVQKKGAGYTAQITPLLTAQMDQWFRPIDVCTAPDGSVFVADWYDPIVGGGAAGDAEKGRIYRIHSGTGAYKVNAAQLENVEMAIESLKSPNMATRYLAWTFLQEKGAEAEFALLKLWNNKSTVYPQSAYRARALWLLGILPEKGGSYLKEALADENPNMRIIGIRMARQKGLAGTSITQPLLKDPAPEVRRELAISLYQQDSPEAIHQWVKLASQYDGKDEWYLEALGIGAMDKWETCMTALQDEVGAEWIQEEGKDLVWRSRTASSLPALADIILASKEEKEISKMFRAFDFHEGTEKEGILKELLIAEHEKAANVKTLVLQHIDPYSLKKSPEVEAAIASTLERVEGSQEYLNMIDRFDIRGEEDKVLELALAEAENELGRNALITLINGKQLENISSRIAGSETDARKIIPMLGKIGGGSEAALKLLQASMEDPDLDISLKKMAVQAMGSSWWGESYLLSCVKEENFDKALKPAAAGVLFNVYRVSVQQEAEQYLDRPASAQATNLPPVRELIASEGDGGNGQLVYAQYCQSCHVVKGQGVEFGPELSQIGSKLSKEGLYRSIIYPSEGINYDYEGYTLKLKNGMNVSGIVESETEEFIDLRLMGGISKRYEVADIEMKEALGQSFMPPLAAAMTPDELIDLVTYLSSLKSEELQAYAHKR
ncbi:MAG: PVC-type heme-binding CxxCH protein [Bacteroidota bacterium]